MGFIYYQHTLSTLVTAFVGVVPAKALNISSVPRWCLYMRPSANLAELTLCCINPCTVAMKFVQLARGRDVHFRVPDIFSCSEFSYLPYILSIQQ